MDFKAHRRISIIQVIACLFSVFSLFAGCKKSLEDANEVYRNDFEQGVLTGITGGKINTFNNSKVIGYYNNGGFDLNLDNLPAHDLVKITFDLYIHDSWAGNNTGEGVIDGPDIWQMNVDGDMYINTTFSNIFCDQEVYCPVQSYPRNFPFRNTAGTGAYRRDLPGACFFKNVIGGTSLYKIERTIKHTKHTLLLDFKDLLKQSNSSDPLCDESWSMDNLVITTYVLK